MHVKIFWSIWNGLSWVAFGVSQVGATTLRLVCVGGKGDWPYLRKDTWHMRMYMCMYPNDKYPHIIRFWGLEVHYNKLCLWLLGWGYTLTYPPMEFLQITCPSSGISSQLWFQLQREVSPLWCYQLGRHVNASQLERHDWTKQDPQPFLGWAWRHPFAASTWHGATTHIARFMPCVSPWMGPRPGSQWHMPFGEASVFSRSKVWCPASKCIHLFYTMDQWQQKDDWNFLVVDKKTWHERAPLFLLVIF